MAFRASFLAGVRVLAICLLFAVCFAVVGALSGIDKIAQQPAASQPAASHPAPPYPAASGNQQLSQMPENFLGSFLVLTLCAGARFPT